MSLDQYKMTTRPKWQSDGVRQVLFTFKCFSVRQVDEILWNKAWGDILRCTLHEAILASAASAHRRPQTRRRHTPQRESYSPKLANNMHEYCNIVHMFIAGWRSSECVQFSVAPFALAYCRSQLMSRGRSIGGHISRSVESENFSARGEEGEVVNYVKSPQRGVWTSGHSHRRNSTAWRGTLRWPAV